MHFTYALSMALAGSAIALDNAPVPTSVSPASASAAAASIASRVVSEINAAATVATTANNIAKTLNAGNVLSVGSNVAGDFAEIIETLSNATTDLSKAVNAANSGTLPKTGSLMDAYKPAECLHADDPKGCVADATSKLGLPAMPSQKRDNDDDAFAGSIAARAAQVSGGGSVTISFSAVEQSTLANTFRNYVALQNTLVNTIAQQRAIIGYYLIPIRNSIIVLQGTADALALAEANALSAQYDTIIAQAKTSMDASLAVAIRAYAS